MQTRDMNLQLVAIFLEKGFTLDFDPATGKARPEATVLWRARSTDSILRIRIPVCFP